MINEKEIYKSPRYGHCKKHKQFKQDNYRHRALHLKYRCLHEESGSSRYSLFRLR